MSSQREVEVYYEAPNSDPDGIIQIWKNLVAEFTSNEDEFRDQFERLKDPDLTPFQFVDVLLRDYGNPFIHPEIQGNLTLKRKLLRALFPIYANKGILPGMVNATRTILGYEIEIIDPYKDVQQGWQVGIGEVGLTTFAGGDWVYCNMLNWTEDFTQADWTKQNLVVQADQINGPIPFGRLSDSFDFSAANSSIAQTVTPIDLAGYDFTFTIFAKSSAATALTMKISSIEDPNDFSETVINISENWERFELEHNFSFLNFGDVKVEVYSTIGVAETVYLWGAQLVRDENLQTQPYAMRTNDGEDCHRPGRWAYHFIVSVPEELTDAQREIQILILDYMKAHHQHYSIIEPVDPNFVDHWEVGLSEVGLNTYVHE